MREPAARFKQRYMCLDGLAIEIGYEHPEVGELLEFMLTDLQPEVIRPEQIVAQFCFSREHNEWALVQVDGTLELHRSQLSDLIMPLFNASMQIFAERNSHSISLHAALVSDNSGSILMPGAPGSGKSNACLWLSHLGMHYHTDELVTVNREDLSLHALPRPFTLRKEALHYLRTLPTPPLDTGNRDTRSIESSANIWIKHRAINPNFQKNIPPLKSIVFPVYTRKDKNFIAEASRAQVGMELMLAHFQSQSFADHGFTTISALVRNLPTYVLVYNHFDQLSGLLKDLLDISPQT